MEFDFENLNIQSKFNRLYHMMTIINQNKKYDQTNKVNYIDFKKKFYEITDIEYDKYIKCYMIIIKAINQCDQKKKYKKELNI